MSLRLLLISALLFAACRRWDEAYEKSIDAGLISTDAGEPDAGHDGGSSDAGHFDAGSPDAGVFDAGFDAGLADAGRCPGGGWCLFDGGDARSFQTSVGAIFATSPDDAWVGLNRLGVLHWNGHTWAERRVGSDDDNSIYAVWGNGPNDMVFGTRFQPSYRGSPTTPVALTLGPTEFRALSGAPDGGVIYATGISWDIYRLDDSTWSTFLPGNPPPSGVLEGLFVISPTDIWAAGTEGRILHSTNGDVFTGLDAGVSKTLFKVFATSSTDVWFAGAEGTVVRWNGSTFIDHPCAACGTIQGLWGRGANDMWLYTFEGQLFHWNGSSYEYLATQANTYELPVGLWGAGDFDLFFTSYDDTSPQPRLGNLLVFHLIR